MVPFLRVEEELKIVTQEGHWDRPELSYSFWSSLIQPIEEQLLERARKSHVENSGDRTCMKFKKWAWEVLHCSGRTPCTRTGWRLTITKKKKDKKTKQNKKKLSWTQPWATCWDDPALSGGLVYMILRGPFLPQPFIWFSDVKIKKKKKITRICCFSEKKYF